MFVRTLVKFQRKQRLHCLFIMLRKLRKSMHVFFVANLIVAPLNSKPVMSLWNLPNLQLELCCECWQSFRKNKDCDGCASQVGLPSTSGQIATQRFHDECVPWRFFILLCTSLMISSQRMGFPHPCWKNAGPVIECDNTERCIMQQFFWAICWKKQPLCCFSSRLFSNQHLQSFLSWCNHLFWCCQLVTISRK